MHTYHFIRISGNTKTGPIPVTTTSADSCPPTCSFINNGCYAGNGPLALHWKKVTAGQRGGTLQDLCDAIQALPVGQLWRHNQAGDLPSKTPGVIDSRALYRLVAANSGRRGFTYTHYRPEKNKQAIARANAMGFTVNLSAETLEEADAFYDLNIAPVVCVLPKDQQKNVYTPAGRLVIVCPASKDDANIDCLNCGICQQRNRWAIVGFPAHGVSAKRVEKIFYMKKEQTP